MRHEEHGRIAKAVVIDGMRLDLLHLFRSVRRSPISAAAAVLTLALTMGAGVSIFALVNAVLLTPPPFTNPESLVRVGETPTAEPTATPRAVPYATFTAWRDRAGSMAVLEAIDGTNVTLTGLGAAERLSANDVTPGFLALLGVRPQLGRLFDAADFGQRVVIVSGAFWRSTLAADPAVIGREIVLGGQRHTIVGVLPDRFVFGDDPNPAALWRPIPLAPTEAARTGYTVFTIARLAKNTTPQDLASALDDVSRTRVPPARASVTRVADAFTRNAVRPLTLLMGAAALAVLIAFVNLAGLLLVRSIDRRRELAVRSALGAGRTEVARQLMLEAVLLVTLGLCGGVLLAVWLTPVAGQLAAAQFRVAGNVDLGVSWRVIGIVVIVAYACALACAMMPALTAMGGTVVDVLRRGVTSSSRDVSIRRVLVAAEVAVAFVLLVSMALVGRTLFTVLAVNPGFDARAVTALPVSLPRASYPTDERVAAFYASLQSALAERFGQGRASVIDELPLTHDRGRRLVGLRENEVGREAVVRTVGAGYFDVMRIPIVSGRSLTAGDDASAPARVVISESLARRIFGRERAVGRQIRLAAPPQVFEVVGVVGEVKLRALDEMPMPTLYVPALQMPSRTSVIVVRSERSSDDVAAVVRSAVAQLDANLPVYGVRPMTTVVNVSPGVPQRRLLATVFMAFAVLAVCLSAIGLFGVAAHEVASRRFELAVRAAFGANPRHLLGATLGRGAVMVASGLAAGGVLSIWAARALGDTISTVGRADALSILLAATVLIVAGASAVLPAAIRAARTDPLMAIRAE
ncbi:MAG TPA: ABC transporter permease [Vicinamibacterales bacterium]